MPDTDPWEAAEDELLRLGASPVELNAIACMADLFGPPDDLASALHEYRQMAQLHQTKVLST